MYKLIDTDAQVTGTSLKGHIKADYADLVGAFGEPAYKAERDGFNDKVWTEWKLEFENADGDYITATIYDGKEQGPFVSRENGEYNWHIGGDSYDATTAVEDMLDAYKSSIGDMYAEGLVG